jgi:hypothetical protein
LQTQIIPNPTPRRLSKRKLSSAIKTPEVMPTPRRISKKVKRSSIIKPLETEFFAVNEDNLNNEIITPSELFSELTINENNEQNINEMESNEKKENKSEEKNDNKVDKNNDSDKEWMTDDEDGEEKMETEEFFDAIDEGKDSHDLKTSVNTENKKAITSSNTKPKRKKESQYFTPSIGIPRSGRATTRMQSRIVNSSKIDSQTTPTQTINLLSSNTKSSALRSIITRQMEANISSSGENNSQKYGSSSRSVKHISRIQKQVPDTKALTASAAKRRQEAEEQRRMRLQASQEKEKRALEKRGILLQQAVNEKKMRSQEKANRAAEIRELQKQKDSEKLKKEQEKREEQERKLKKLEEERREILRKKHEEMLKKTQENEKRKQLQELKEAEIKLQKQEELRKKQELERERILEQERMTAMIQQHNNSLQQKATALSFLKKIEAKQMKLVLTKISPPLNTATQQMPNVSPNKPQIKTVEEVTANQTFVVTKEDEKPTETSVYDMTPPPKEHNYDNYDISEIKSDDDTDDERNPRKHIPNWARGSQFIDSLKRQYAKSFKSKERELRSIFTCVQMPVELGLIFGPQKAVAAKYSKRTSSAVWNSPPTLHPNVSINSSKSETSFYKN